VEVTPESLQERGLIKALRDGVKLLGGKAGAGLPAGLRIRHVLVSASARDALTAAGATLDDGS
jgi:ribosomal protein L15